MNSKHIYLLIGKKGSGKSFLGSIIEKEFGIKFIRVEDWARQIKKDQAVDDEAYVRDVFKEIEMGIRASLKEVDSLVFESTGLTVSFDQMLSHLKKDFRVTTIGVVAESRICLDRVKARDQTIHINLSDDQVIMINQRVQEKNFNADFLIINETKTRKELVEELRNIIALAKNSKLNV